MNAEEAWNALRKILEEEDQTPNRFYGLEGPGVARVVQNIMDQLQAEMEPTTVCEHNLPMEHLFYYMGTTLIFTSPVPKSYHDYANGVQGSQTVSWKDWSYCPGPTPYPKAEVPA